VADEVGGERRAVSGTISRITSPLLLLALAVACGGTVSPLRHHAIVGRDTYAIFVADGPDGVGDLFGVRGDGGAVFQITFTPVREARPALSPDGAMVAFLRGRARGDSVADTPWVMNLLTGAERRLELPAAADAAEIGWSRDGGVLYVRSGRFAYELPAPPETDNARAVPPQESHQVDAALGVFVGESRFARVLACGQGLCATTDSSPPVLIADTGRDPARWGPDSLGYFAGEELVVRPVGPGRARRVAWDRQPRRARQLTAFVGRGRTDADGESGATP
jgi:hypothetical protein